MVENFEAARYLAQRDHRVLVQAGLLGRLGLGRSLLRNGRACGDSEPGHVDILLLLLFLAVAVVVQPRRRNLEATFGPPAEQAEPKSVTSTQ